MDIMRRLYSSADARVWAEEFVKVTREKPHLATDTNFMIGWFANAMETARTWAAEPVIPALMESRCDTASTPAEAYGSGHAFCDCGQCDVGG